MEELIKTKDKYFNRFFLILSILITVIIAVRSAVIPFCWDETFTFFNYVQNGDFLPFIAHPLQNNHFLNSFFSWICFHCFDDSPFSLRLPNLLSLFVVIVGVYRLSMRMSQLSSKIILASGLLLSFHWLGFFNLCRGYGISMAFMVLALSYVPDFIENKKVVTVLKIYLLLDVAVCANLSLIAATAIVTLLVCVYQLRQRNFFKGLNLFVLLIHCAILIFWIKYAFFLRQHDSLGSAHGSYWQITFVSLIYGIVGEQNRFITLSVLAAYIVMTGASFYVLIRNRERIKSPENQFLLLLTILLNGLIIGIYLQKKLTGIDYPEQRAALFFYPLLILNAACLTEVLKPRFQNIIAVLVFSGFASHFACNINFRKHNLDMYSVIPERFYDRLVLEQKQNPERITIGGNAFSQLIFSFMNYRHNGALNPLNYPDSMSMDADYYIAMKSDRKYYLPYYKEIDTDKQCFTLLQRREALVRIPMFAVENKVVEMDTGNEYFNFFELKDTTFAGINPLLVQFDFNVKSGSMPFFGWLVLSIDTSEGKTVLYKQLPLNRVMSNWLDLGGKERLILQTGVLPKRIHRMVCYLWNVRHQQINMTMDLIKVSQLIGVGVTASAPHAKDLIFR